MKIKIKEVIPGEFETVFTTETHLNEYRRYKPNVWEHKLGHIWQPYDHCEDLEDAYAEWQRNNK